MNQLSKNYLKQIEGKYNQSKENIKEKTWQEKNIDQMTDRDWRIFREDMDIFIKGGRVAYPFR
jgi:ATP-dependent RNA helicase DDX23/PRP28